MNRKRQFAPASQGKRQIRIAVVVVCIVGILAVPATRTGIRVTVRSIGMVITRSATGVGNFFGTIGTAVSSKISLQKENDLLQSRIAELTARLDEHDLLASQNAELKASLGRADGLHFILAAVVSKYTNSLYDTFTIDGGTKAGLAVGQVVYAYGQTPIGHIVATFPNTATVQLFSTPGETYDARLSPSGIDVTLTGRGGGNFVTTVPHDLVIDTQSIAVTKELHSRIIALYQKVTSDPRDPFQTLLLVAPVNINQLSFVEVAQ